MILLWGLLTDAPMAQVYEELTRRGAAVFFVDQRLTPDARIELVVDGGVSGRLCVGGAELPLEHVTAAYFRPYNLDEIDTVEHVPRDSAQWRHLLRFESLLLAWLELAPILVVNRPSDMASNNSKPYQIEILRETGLRVPATLLTTSAAAARAFWARQDRLIYKSISSTRSIVAELARGRDDSLPDVTHCPTQFQQWVGGDDVRVHVIGDEVFACRIVAPTADYRYSREARLEPLELPPKIAAACRAAARRLGFHFTGIDLRRTPDDEWYCFEANPSPGFSYFAAATGQPIAERVAALLCRFEPGPAPCPAGDDSCPVATSPPPALT